MPIYLNKHYNTESPTAYKSWQDSDRNNAKWPYNKSALYFQLWTTQELPPLGLNKWTLCNTTIITSGFWNQIIIEPYELS